MEKEVSQRQLLNKLENDFQQNNKKQKNINKKTNKSLYDLIEDEKINASQNTIKLVYKYITNEDIEQVIFEKSKLPTDYESIKQIFLNKLSTKVFPEIFDSQYISFDDIEDIFNDIYERGYLKNFSKTIVESNNDLYQKALLEYYCIKFDKPKMQRLPRYVINTIFKLLNSDNDYIHFQAFKTFSLLYKIMKKQINLSDYQNIKIRNKYYQEQYNKYIQDLKEIQNEKRN